MRQAITLSLDGTVAPFDLTRWSEDGEREGLKVPQKQPKIEALI